MSRKEIYREIFETVLADDDFEKALAIGDDVEKLTRQVILPRIAAINAYTQQLNDPRFMAYALIMILELEVI